MIKHSSKTEVYRDDNLVEIDFDEIVPGDIILC